jgi:hypothetical protein
MVVGVFVVTAGGRMLLSDAVFAGDLRDAEKSIMPIDVMSHLRKGISSEHSNSRPRNDPQGQLSGKTEQEESVGPHCVRTQGTHHETRGGSISREDRMTKEEIGKGGRLNHGGADSWRREEGGTVRVGDDPQESKDHNEDDIQREE